jgi:hypothetical protein
MAKWTYKHVTAVGIRKDMKVTAGQPIGKVVKTDTLPAHVHLDRGTGVDQAVQKGIAGAKVQPIPNLNPVKEFAPTLDTVKPTIDGLLFRPAKEDDLGTTIERTFPTGPDEKFKLKDERLADRKLFTDTGTVRGQAVALIGRLPEPWSDGSASISSPDIDIISNMYDQFGIAAGATVPKVGITRASFNLKGQKFERTTGTVAAVDLDTIRDPALKSYTYFTSFERTRSIYANDQNADSEMTGPYFYTVTNTSNRTADFGGITRLPTSPRTYYWSSTAPNGSPWNDNTGKHAKRNADSNYPDDVYEVKVTAYDVSGNTTDKTVYALLDNWKQSITVSGNGAIITGGDIVLTKAQQFRANQAVSFYYVPASNPNDSKLANGTALPAANKIGQVQMDANGEQKNIKFQNKAPNQAGTYWIVADYDDDQQFSERLDAATKITVNQPMDNGPIFAAGHAYETSHGSTMVVGRPGLLLGGQSPDWGNTTVSIVDDPNNPDHYGTLDLLPDGSFTYVPDVPGPAMDDYEYELTDGDGNTAMASFLIWISDEAPTTPDDDFFAPHDRTLHVPVDLGVLSNDSDWDTDPLTASVSAAPQDGSVTVNPDGSFDYTPNPGFVGTDSFSYTASDGLGGSNLGVATVEVMDEVADPAVDSYSTAPGQALAIPDLTGVLSNDADADSDALTAYIPTDDDYGPHHGTVTLNSDGSFEYTPEAGFLGDDSFMYRANDGIQDSVPRIVSLHVTKGALINDRVWNDLNQGGLQDPGEPGVPGVTVQLLDGTGTVVAQTETDNDGLFAFDVVPGTYRIQVVIPAGASASPRQLGTDPAGDSDIDSTGQTDLFTLANGDQVTDVDAGLFGSGLPLPAVQYGSVSGRVWSDADADGIQGPFEAGLSDVPVALLDSEGTTVASTVTDQDGAYNFSAVPEGWYQIRATLPSGASASPRYQGEAEDVDSDIDGFGVSGLLGVPADGAADHVDAGFVTRVVSGRAWLDADGDGIRQETESGMAGITVQLLDANGFAIAYTTTRDDGTYVFTNVADGQYRVQFALPEGYAFTQPNQGSDPSTDSDVTDSVAGTTDLFRISGDNKFDLSAGFVAL